MIELNKTYRAAIVDITTGGDGIAKIDGYPVFVKGALPGDVAEFKTSKLNKSYGFGKLLKITEPSEFRRESPCDSFGECGGCTLLELDYKKQLQLKSDFVLSNIKKIGSVSPDSFIYEEPIEADDEFYYRNKAQFPVRNKKGRAVCGFFESKSHKLVSCKDCCIQNETINRAVDIVMDFINAEHIKAYNEEKHTGVIRHIYLRYSAEGKSLMVVLVTNTKDKIKNAPLLAERLEPLGLKCLVQNINTKKTNVILGDKNITLYGDDHILMKVDELVFKVSPHSFFQVNTEQMKKLYKKALDYASLTGKETVFDLYCGVGSISLFLARAAKKVIGVELIPDAIDNARENAELSGISNAEFYLGDCTEVTDELISKGERADVVVLDPPRKGCDDKLLSLVNNISPQKIVYVSCNSSTLARDIKILSEYGYTLKKCTAVDLFPQGTHCEAVALLER